MTGSQIRTEITRIIDSIIVDDNPRVVDEDMPDFMADGDERSKAIDTLIKIIEFYRETL